MEWVAGQDQTHGFPVFRKLRRIGLTGRVLCCGYGLLNGGKSRHLFQYAQGGGAALKDTVIVLFHGILRRDPQAIRGFV